MKHIEEAIQALPEYLVEHGWLVMDDGFSDGLTIILDESDTEDEDDYRGSYTPIAENIQQGEDHGEALATYIAACSPHVVLNLLAQKEYLSRVVEALEEKIEQVENLAESWESTGNGHYRDIQQALELS